MDFLYTEYSGVSSDTLQYSIWVNPLYDFLPFHQNDFACEILCELPVQLQAIYVNAGTIKQKQPAKHVKAF